jgi:hypothetical protein
VRLVKLVLGVFAVLIAGLGVFLLWAGGRIGGPDEAEYKAENARILESLPQFPGASFLWKIEHAQFNDEDRPFVGPPVGFGPPTGWTTTYLYELPQGTTWRRLASFYLAGLQPEWKFPQSHEGGAASYYRIERMILIRGAMQLDFGFEPSATLANDARPRDPYPLLSIQLDRDCPVTAEWWLDERCVELRG